jgi:hypothetical protein
MESVFDDGDLENLIDKVAGGSWLSDEHRRSLGRAAANQSAEIKGEHVRCLNLQRTCRYLQLKYLHCCGLMGSPGRALAIAAAFVGAAGLELAGGCSMSACKGKLRSLSQNGLGAISYFPGSSSLAH